MRGSSGTYHIAEADGSTNVSRPQRTTSLYTTDTDHGSSGSPVFDLDWNLGAVHHASLRLM